MRLFIDNLKHFKRLGYVIEEKNFGCLGNIGCYIVLFWGFGGDLEVYCCWKNWEKERFGDGIIGYGQWECRRRKEKLGLGEINRFELFCRVIVFVRLIFSFCFRCIFREMWWSFIWNLIFMIGFRFYNRMNFNLLWFFIWD